MKLNNMDKKWVKGLVILIILGVLVYGPYSDKRQNQHTSVTSSVQEYTLINAQIKETLSTTGTVQAELTEKLLGDINSEVTAIYVEVGDQVSVGQVLAQMKPIDGVVTALNIEEGEIPKDSDVMIEIQELSGYSSATYYMPYTTIDKLFNLGGVLKGIEIGVSNGYDNDRGK